MKRWIRAPARPSAALGKKRGFCPKLRHLRRRGTSVCLSRLRVQPVTTRSALDDRHFYGRPSYTEGNRTWRRSAGEHRCLSSQPPAPHGSRAESPGRWFARCRFAALPRPHARKAPPSPPVCAPARPSRTPSNGWCATTGKWRVSRNRPRQRQRRQRPLLRHRPRRPRRLPRRHRAQTPRRRPHPRRRPWPHPARHQRPHRKRHQPPRPQRHPLQHQRQIPRGPLRRRQRRRPAGLPLRLIGHRSGTSSAAGRPRG